MPFPRAATVESSPNSTVTGKNALVVGEPLTTASHLKTITTVNTPSSALEVARGTRVESPNRKSKLVCDNESNEIKSELSRHELVGRKTEPKEHERGDDTKHASKGHHVEAGENIRENREDETRPEEPG